MRGRWVRNGTTLARAPESLAERPQAGSTEVGEATGKGEELPRVLKAAEKAGAGQREAAVANLRGHIGTVDSWLWATVPPQQRQSHRMEGLSGFLRLITPEAWLLSWDLAEAYFHLMLHPETTRYFGGAILSFASSCVLTANRAPREPTLQALGAATLHA